MSGSDPYANAFERDYTNGGDFWRKFGSGETNLTIVRFSTRQTYDKSSNRTTDEPVVYFSELGNKPMYVNKTSHENYLNALGDEYWKPENKHAGTVIRLMATRKQRSDGPQVTVIALGKCETMTGTVEETFEYRFLEGLGKRELKLTDFLWWLGITNRKDEAENLSALAVSDWPKSSIKLVKQYIDQVDSGDGGVREPV